MKEFLTAQGIFFIRVFLAALCGGLIGYERKNRGKRAGVRTHLIVAVASALMMLISKYGFLDLPYSESSAIKFADPARLSAQVVSGVGFLGAGMIYFNRKKLQGLTTAAGIWATSGVGLAMGAGMYVIGIFVTLVILLSQIILHKNLKFLHTPNEETIIIVLDDCDDSVSLLKSSFEKNGVVIERIKIKKMENSLLEIEADISSDAEFDMISVLDFAQKTNFIKSVEID